MLPGRNAIENGVAMDYILSVNLDNSMETTKTLGLIVNPIAGMGGRVGLKGTDGPEILEQARALGAVPRAQERTREAIAALVPIRDRFSLLTCPGAMGEEAARSAGLTLSLVAPSGNHASTSAQDTIEAARAMQEAGADLLMFAGGDGTARDIFTAVGEDLVTIGIPAGVKIHSAVFSIHPQAGGEVAADFLCDRIREVRSCEVMDIDEEEYREGRLSARLFGYLCVPHARRRLQSQKIRTPVHERHDQEAVAAGVAGLMSGGILYIIGPGTTTRSVLEGMGLGGTLLGVDVVRDGRLVAQDVNESQLLSLIEPGRTRLIVTPIGGQGNILGRGNQQVSPRVLASLRKTDLHIIATPHKIHSLQGAPLRVDTGDPDLDARLSGYHRVITGFGESVIYKVTR
jgi:predicted polyphosphate/ATP-dependent NAD kinase